MSEKTNNAPSTWAEGLQKAIEQWKENTPGDFDIFVLVVKDGEAANVAMDGKSKNILDGLISCMSGADEEDNVPGKILRAAAYQFFFENAQPVAAVEVKMMPADEESESDNQEPANNESHE